MSEVRPDLNGVRLQAVGRPDIWLIFHGRRHKVATSTVYDSLFSETTGLLSNNDLEMIDEGPELNEGTCLVQFDTEHEIYLLTGVDAHVSIHEITSFDSFTDFSFDLQKVRRLPSLMRRLLRRGEPLISAPDQSVTAIVQMAIRLHKTGDAEASAKIVKYLCDTYPHLPYGWREAAVLRKAAADDHDALRLLQRAFELDPSLLSVTQLARQLAGMNLQVRARILILKFKPASPGDAGSIELLDELLKFMIFVPYVEAKRLMDEFSSSPRYVDAELEIEQMILSALRERRAFSLIRLGDGEGAWLNDLSENNGRYRKLYIHNRREILRKWFCSDALLNRHDFCALIPRLENAVRQADIIGIPYPGRIDWEYSIASPDGIPSCMSILRFAKILKNETQAFFCSHDVHFDLQWSGALYRILRTRCKLGIISCYPALAIRLQEAFGVCVVSNLIIPEEKGMSEVIGPNGSKLQHFPDVFFRIVERLRAQTWTATLWLVAASYLGKIYCGEIRAAGGVAIDIGSAADGWMGKTTRPTIANDVAMYRLDPS